jgi:putative hydrolase of the HAD superfamily
MTPECVVRRRPQRRDHGGQPSRGPGTGAEHSRLSKSLLPSALLLDLDDTILDDTGAVDDCWTEACQDSQLGADVDQILSTIKNVRDWYWSDPERHRVGRLDMDAARHRIVSLALQRLARDDDHLANGIARRYTRFRDLRLTPLSGAIETIEWFRAAGCRTALLTNGAGKAQRRKIERFDLERLFDVILIEGELGFGKPDQQVFRQALSSLDVSTRDAWMVGDNLAWDVAPAQQLGIHAVWIDRTGKGLPSSAVCRPDRIIRTLAELRF